MKMNINIEEDEFKSWKKILLLFIAIEMLILVHLFWSEIFSIITIFLHIFKLELPYLIALVPILWGVYTYADTAKRNQKNKDHDHIFETVLLMNQGNKQSHPEYITVQKTAIYELRYLKQYDEFIIGILSEHKDYWKSKSLVSEINDTIQFIEKRVNNKRIMYLVFLYLTCLILFKIIILRFFDII
jgi:hypothetical protein